VLFGSRSLHTYLITRQLSSNIHAVHLRRLRCITRCLMHSGTLSRQLGVSMSASDPRITCELCFLKLLPHSLLCAVLLVLPSRALPENPCGYREQHKHEGNANANASLTSRAQSTVAGYSRVY
jgi:hypothetical protein